MAINPKQLKPKVERLLGVFIAKCLSSGIRIIPTHGYRSIAEQNAIYAQGRTKPGKIVTNAKGGQSLHNFGVAFDICFSDGKRAFYPPKSDPRWNKIAKIAKNLGLEWGDRGYIDYPHFQFRAGYSLQDFQKNKIDWSKFK